MKNFEQAEKVLTPKGRDMVSVLNWIEDQGYEPPSPPGDVQRRLHRSGWRSFIWIR